MVRVVGSYGRGCCSLQVRDLWYSRRLSRIAGWMDGSHDKFGTINHLSAETSFSITAIYRRMDEQLRLLLYL